MLPSFALIRPTSVRGTLASLNDEQVPYCGGTELLLAMKSGLQQPEALVDLKRVDALTEVYPDAGHLVIGSTAAHVDVAGHSLVKDHFPMLAEVESAVGNARVRAQGSIGGNLCFAEPKSDLATALIALDATVTLAHGDDERRTVSVQDFVIGAYEAAKSADELLVDVRVPLQEERRRAIYLKYQTRERPTIGVAISEVNAGCRLVVGAVGEFPMTWFFDSPRDISPTDVARQIDPVPEITGSELYLRHIAELYVSRAIQAFAEKRN